MYDVIGIVYADKIYLFEQTTLYVMSIPATLINTMGQTKAPVCLKEKNRFVLIF